MINFHKRKVFCNSNPLHSSLFIALTLVTMKRSMSCSSFSQTRCLANNVFFLSQIINIIIIVLTSNFLLFCISVIISCVRLHFKQVLLVFCDVNFLSKPVLCVFLFFNHSRVHILILFFDMFEVAVVISLNVIIILDLRIISSKNKVHACTT